MPVPLIIRQKDRRLLLLILLVLCQLVSFAYDVEVDGVYYNLDKANRAATVTYSSYGQQKGGNHTPYTGDFVIPETITCIDWDNYPNTITYTVSKIGDDAFKDCSVTSVAIPESVTEIGIGAFRWCEHLKTVMLPSSLRTIGGGAFYDCNALEGVFISDLTSWCNINFGDNPLYYAHNLFLDGTLITDLIVPPAVTSIPDMAFVHGNFLSVTLPVSLQSIGKRAFSRCDNLTTIVIPDFVETIGDDAFRYCKNLSSVSLGTAVTIIGSYAFSQCEQLKSITLPVNVRTVGEGAFYLCIKMITAKLNNGLLVISKGMFEGCRLLTQVDVPSTVEYVNDRAFYDCEVLPSIHLSNVKIIGNEALNRCFALESVEVGSKLYQIGEDAFRFCQLLQDFQLPASVLIIGDGAFAYTNLAQISIPDGISTIGKETFYECRNLDSVTLPATITQVGDNAFAACYQLKEVHISDLAAWSSIDFFNERANPMSYSRRLMLNGELLDEIVIPQGVTRIGNYAFIDSEAIIMDLPTTISTIGKYAFCRAQMPELAVPVLSGWTYSALLRPLKIVFS